MAGNDVREFAPVGDRRFRVLSLDGGGIQGAFTASLLAEIEEDRGVRLGDYFDLIAGTSTGGIIALGLGLGLSARDVSDLYQEHGPTIFPEARSRKWRLFRRVFGPASLDPLAEALEDVFEDRQLGESGTRLVIPSFNAGTGDVYLIKTSHHPRFSREYKWPATDAALATAAAPTYFEMFISKDGERFLDGGIWANNPIAVAMNEAVGVLGARLGSLEILSIGTTTSPFHLPAERATDGIAELVVDGALPELYYKAQDAGAMGLAETLIPDKSQIVRVNETTDSARFALDDPTDLEDLRAVGKEKARQAGPEIRRRFLDTATPEFIPYRALDGDSD